MSDLATHIANVTTYIANALTSHIASMDSNSDNSDFILRVEGNQIAYVDVEAGDIFLITVERANLVAAGGDES